MFRAVSNRASFRRALAAAAFGALLVTGSQAHAFDLPWWWPFKPAPQPAPEIDAGLVRSAAAILVGGLLVLRSRKRSS